MLQKRRKIEDDAYIKRCNNLSETLQEMEKVNKSDAIKRQQVNGYRPKT